MSQDEIQKANDMLEMMQAQRNAQANECVTLMAQLKAASRKVSELEAKVAELESKATDIDVIVDDHRTNGHDASASALS